MTKKKAKRDLKKPGRKPGQKDQKPRKPRKPKPADKEPIIPEVTPYPKAGDNPDFEGLLDRMDLDDKKEISPDQVQQFLENKDVAEWVSWPFLFWAQYNKMPQLKISDAEARSVAEPLTSILNRHGVGRMIPPDIIDGMKTLGRLSPLVTKRFDMIKTERVKRAEQGGSVEQPAGVNQGGRSPVINTNIEQGAPFRKPEKVK